MTHDEARRLGRLIAARTFWQHDPTSREDDVLMGCRLLANHLRNAGIDKQTHDDLWWEAGAAFRDKCEELFGEDLVVAEQ